jgi:hypothetical protein
MFRLMRNIHLGLGLGFFLMALIFAVSSLTVIFRGRLGQPKPEVTEAVVQLPTAALATPRAAAMELMTSHGLRGDLREIKEKGGTVTFRIVRPGEVADVTYPAATGEAKIAIRRQTALNTLMALHTNHGVWHEYLPANLWAVLGFCTSAGLILLGASGVYLWFKHYNERRIGTVLLTCSLAFGLVALYLTRLEQ